VEQGLEKLIRAAVKAGGAILQSLGKLLGFRDIPSHEFQEEDGHTHTLAFPAKGSEPTVASDRPQAVTEFVKAYGTDADQAEAKTLLTQLAPLVDELTPPKAPKEPKKTAVQKQVRDLEVKLGKVLARVFKDNPKAKKHRWKAEGTTGPFSSMQFPGDRMDADHQPHWKLLGLVQELIVGGAPTGPFLFEAKNLRKGGLRNRAYTIVLSRPRHALGRTYGGGSHKAAADALKKLTAKATTTTEVQQRTAAIQGLKESMLEDVKAMRAVAKRDPSDKTAWADVPGGGEARKELI
jgi:hypothetical protein